MALQLDKDEVRDYLINLAKQRRTCGYKELADDIAGVGSYTIGNNDGNYVAGKGGEISEEEALVGRPLLSVLIVNQDTHLPGDGFFKLAKKWRLFHGNVKNKADQRAYTKIELARVYGYWSTQLDGFDEKEVELLQLDFDASKTPEEKEVVIKRLERGKNGDIVKVRNGYKCQVCEAMKLNPFGFIKRDGTLYIESHHVEPVNTRKAGVLLPSNIITVCANHHRQMHDGNVERIEKQETDDYFVFKIDGQKIQIAKIRVN